MPITRLEMVSSAFHSQAKRGRNAGETQPKPERPPCEKHAGTLVHWYKRDGGEREKRSGVSIAVAFRQRSRGWDRNEKEAAETASVSKPKVRLTRSRKRPF